MSSKKKKVAWLAGHGAFLKTTRKSAVWRRNTWKYEQCVKVSPLLPSSHFIET